MKYFLNAATTLLTTPSMWILIIIPIAIILCLGLICLIIILAFALVPQAKGISSWFPETSGYTALGYIISVMLCLAYSAIATFILFVIFGARTEDRVFDVTLKNRCPHLYDTHSANVDPDDQDSGDISRLDILAAAALIITLPINLIPVAGQIIYIGANALLQGKVAHDRYFDLKGWGPKKRNAFYNLHRNDYIIFGAYKTAFQLVPIVNLLGGFINAIAAANFAADLELEMIHNGTSQPVGVI